jgi:hypothetical protein
VNRRFFLAAPVSLFANPLDGLAYSLRQYVTATGRVRYAALKADLAPLEGYVKHLATFDPSRLPSREAKLAHWINVYNALILWSFASDYPQQKDRLLNPVRRTAYFYARNFLVAGRSRTLAGIEDHSIREAFREPRIHFAIVCASASCPALSPEIYTAANVLAKLEQDAIRFLRADRNLRIDLRTKTVTTSEIFNWFQKDFGGSPQAVLHFIARYRTEARLSEPGWTLRFFDYDWSINDSPLP